MAERLKAHAWKACVRESVPRVRIPVSPPEIIRNVLISFQFSVGRLLLPPKLPHSAIHKPFIECIVAIRAAGSTVVASGTADCRGNTVPHAGLIVMGRLWTGPALLKSGFAPLAGVCLRLESLARSVASTHQKGLGRVAPPGHRRNLSCAALQSRGDGEFHHAVAQWSPGQDRARAGDDGADVS
jgi:hypothetical protein